MAYVAQLLPDYEQAKVLRTALQRFITPEIAATAAPATEAEIDAAWELLSKLTRDMRNKKG